MEVSDMSKLNSIVTDLERALGGIPETVPPGFRPTKEWSIIWGLKGKPQDLSKTRRILCQRVSEGRMERRTLRIKTAECNSYPVKHYRAVMTGEKQP
jgi:hypothetical protein